MRNKIWHLNTFLLKLVYLLILVFFYDSSQAQLDKYLNNSGVSVRLNMHLGHKKLKSNLYGKDSYCDTKFQYRLCVDVGTIANPFNSDRFLIPVNLSTDIYRHGLGVRNDNRSPKHGKMNYDLIISVGALYGWDSPNSNKPLNHSTIAFTNATIFPHKWGAVIGTRFIFTDIFKQIEPKSKYSYFQRNGYINAHFNCIQLTYTNDGAIPFTNIFGDDFDRYWTGGLLIQYDSKHYRSQLSFNRFTGFKEGAYELATLLGYKQVDYNLQQSLLNRGEWNLRAVYKDDHQMNYGISLIMADYPRLSLQNLLHYFGRMAYHPTYNKKRFYYGAVFEYNPTIEY